MARRIHGPGNRLRRAALLWALRRMRWAIGLRPEPATIRAGFARFGPLLARRERWRCSEPAVAGGATLRWLEAEDADAAAVIFYLHGGAFIADSPAVHEPFVAALCRSAGARALMVDYRLAPEHAFPAAVEDCHAAWQWLLSSGVDPGRVVIAGDSAGGNLAVVTALRARDGGLPLPAGLLLLSPVLDSRLDAGSFERNDGLDPMFRAATLRSLERYYGGGVDRDHPWLSPLSQDLAGLPPSLVLVGSSELLLDDSLRYAARAPQATLEVWHGMPHVFPLFRGLAEGDAAIAGCGRWVRERTAAATAGA